MPTAREPSYTDLVHDVLAESPEPLTVPEIVERVGQRRAIATRNPAATVRNALTQSGLLANLGDGRYCYVPRLVSGSLLRVPLHGKRPANHPIELPADVRDALWPGYFGPQKREVRRPIVARLPSGAETRLSLEFLGTGSWGWPVDDVLRSYLVECRAAPGDSLLVRVVNGEAGTCDLTFESRLRRDEAAIAGRNEGLASAAYQFMRKRGAKHLLFRDISVALLVRGVYRGSPAPDPLEVVLAADQRFTYSGMITWMLTEHVTSELEDEIAARKRGEALASQLLGAPDLSELVGDQPSDPLNQRRAMERTLSDLGALLSEQEFESEEEADSFLNDLIARGPQTRREPATPLDQAQSLMYDAWEASAPRERERLARKALQLSPDCADAYVLLAEETARTPRQAAELYGKGVAAGERALGGEYFRENAGHFWGMVETRPYMRARFGLAQMLWQQGKQPDAIGHLWAMLDLNPSDNQGVRYSLLDFLLTVGDDAGARRLLDRYADEGTAAWAFGAALLAFRTEGDSPRARELLAEAFDANRHVAAYLLGRKRLPREMPQLIGMGDEAEAVTCAAGQLPAWKGARGALAWLDRHAPHR